MTTISKASIRRAVSRFATRRTRHVQDWTSAVVGDFGALYVRPDAETEEEKRILFMLDTVAYGIRWAEMTGRVNTALFHQIAWKDARDVVERIVALCLRAENPCADFVKEAWKELATLRVRHIEEARAAA